MGKSSKQTVESMRRKIRKAAAESGMTMDEIGQAMGFSESGARQAVSRLLTKVDYDPRLSTLLAFAQAIKRPLSDLL